MNIAGGLDRRPDHTPHALPSDQTMLPASCKAPFANRIFPPTTPMLESLLKFLRAVPSALGSNNASLLKKHRKSPLASAVACVQAGPNPTFVELRKTDRK